MTIRMPTVLVIDDNSVRATIIEAGLREAGHDRVTVVTDVTGIAGKIAALAPDVIVIDLENPNRDMLESMFQLSRAVKRPIAMFVDRSDSDAIERAIDAGVSAYVVDGLRQERVKPILDMAIRRRIEALLPQSLSDWTALAQTVRGRISNTLKPGPQRRAFWERFVDRAFGSAPSECSIDDLLLDAASIAGDLNHDLGSVALVGAGPGDPELLSLKAVRVLQAADLILFDDLVSEDVLELARREARRIYVGRLGGHDSARLNDIRALTSSCVAGGGHVALLFGGERMSLAESKRDEIFTALGLPDADAVHEVPAPVQAPQTIAFS